MAVDPELLAILACPECKTPVIARAQWRRAEMRDVQACLSDQGRHPGDAARRSDRRGVATADSDCGFGCRIADSAGAPSPHRRCGVHDAGHSRVAPALPPGAADVPGRSAGGASRARQPASRRGHRHAAIARLSTHRRRPGGLGASCGGAGSTWSSIFMAGLAARGSRGSAARRGGSAIPSPAAAGCTRRPSSARANCGRATRSRTSGTCWPRWASRRRRRSMTRSRWPRTRRPAPAWTRGWRRRACGRRRRWS